METNNIEQLKENIREYIKQNGNKEITGQILQEVLLGMVDGLVGNDAVANPTGEATAPLNKIKIGDTNYNIPQTDISNLATKQELQQGLSGKQDTINDLSEIREGAGEGATALQPLQSGQYTENNFAAFDANGGIKDSLKKESDFATVLQGTKADNAIPMPTGGSDEQILAKDSNETAGVKWVPKPSDGKSALQIYNETYGTNLNEAQFIDVLKQNYPMEYVAYDATAAAQTIGTGFASIGTLAADATTTGKMYFMPNNGTTPTGTILFVTVQTPNSNPATYQWYSLGALSVPSNVLTQANIVDDLATGGTTDVLSAEQGVILSTGWINFSNYTSTDGVYVNFAGNKNASSSPYCEYSVNVSYGECYSIRCKVSSTAVMSVAFFNGDKFMRDVSIICENTTDEYKNYVVVVPQGATEMIVSALKSGTFTIRKSIVNDYNRDIQNLLSSGFENNPTSITEHGYEYGYYIGYSNGDFYGTSDNTTRRLETFEVSAGQLFLIDLCSLPDTTAAVAFYNGTTIGPSTYMPEYSIRGTASQNHIAVFVPTGAVRMCVNSSTDYIYNVRRSTIGIDLNKYIDLSSLDELAAQVAQIADSANKGVIVYNNLQYDYYETGEPIEPSATKTNLYIRSNRKLKSASGSIYRIYAFAPSEQDRWIRIKQYVYSSSAEVGGAFLVDNTDVLVAGTTIPEADILIGANNSTPKTIDRSVFVPAGRILCVSHSTYTNANYCNVYNTVFGSGVINDMQNDIEGLQNSIQETVEDSINNTLGIDAIPSTTNSLEVIKETAGYTSIFRTMGVIGGSMSTGWHSHETGDTSANMPEYSYLQFMARLCGAEGYNFSSGGYSAKVWPGTGQIATNFYDTNKKCQMYIIQLGNNDLAYHSGHPEYTLGTIADLTPTGGTSIADYTYNTDTFYGNMARIINEVRKVQPRAYVFLSTFLKDYGNVPSDFDYNVAIRNIVAYYSDVSNRPTGDELHYYLIDIYKYGKPYSFYNSGIHAGTVIGSHLVATGYNYWAYEFCTYIDWIIKNNMSDFNDVAFVGTDNYN